MRYLPLPVILFIIPFFSFATRTLVSSTPIPKTNNEVLQDNPNNLSLTQDQIDSLEQLFRNVNGGNAKRFEIEREDDSEEKSARDEELSQNNIKSQLKTSRHTDKLKTRKPYQSKRPMNEQNCSEFPFSEAALLGFSKLMKQLVSLANRT